MSKIMKEEDLAKEVLDFLEKDGWNCYPEAMLKYGHGRADIAAVKNNIFRIVEVKMSLSLALLNQANEWIMTKGVDEVFIAVPNVRESRLVHEILQWKGIGKIIVPSRKGYPLHSLSIKPARQQEIKEKIKESMMGSLHDDMKNYKPGTQSGFSTPYNRTINLIEEFLKERGSATMNEILSLKHHYSSRSSARSSLSQALSSFEKDRFTVEQNEGGECIYKLKEQKRSQS